MKSTLKERVNYAARVIREGRQASRKFDGCFEEGDGDAVVSALVRRAAKCPRLTANLPRYIAQSSIAAVAPVSQEDAPTKVVFRVFRDDKDASNPLAIFPEIPSDVAGNFCESYQQVGQHSACDPCIGSRGDTRAATPEEYAALKRELEGKGYVLDVRQKVTDAMHAARRKAAAR